MTTTIPPLRFAPQVIRNKLERNLKKRKKFRCKGKYVCYIHLSKSLESYPMLDDLVADTRKDKKVEKRLRRRKDTSDKVLSFFDTFCLFKLETKEVT